LKKHFEEKRRKMTKWNLRGATFIIDSGCTHHVVNELSLLGDIVFASKGMSIGTMRGCLHGAYVKITAWETIPLLGRVLYAQYITHNIISVSLLDAAGFKVETGKCGNNMNAFLHEIHFKRLVSEHWFLGKM